MQACDRMLNHLSWARILFAGLMSAGAHGALLVASKPVPGPGRDTIAPTVVVVRMLQAPTAGPGSPLAAVAGAKPETGDVPATRPASDLAALPRVDFGPVSAPQREGGAAAPHADEKHDHGPDAAAVAGTASGTGTTAAVVPPALSSASAYLSASQLDPGPRPLDDIEPLFPAEAGQQQGHVVLRILVNEAGVVDDVAVVRSTPQGLFERSAIDAFAAARFSPGRRLGIPVKSQMTIEVDFIPFNRGAAVSGRGY